MGRFSGGGSYGQTIHLEFEDSYRIAWTVDYHYPESRLRYPRRFSLVTNKAGARRFARRWGLTVPTKREA
jgi:hypothetical protein